jgi:hypothetical protein
MADTITSANDGVEAIIAITILDLHDRIDELKLKYCKLCKAPLSRLTHVCPFAAFTVWLGPELVYQFTMPLPQAGAA